MASEEWWSQAPSNAATLGLLQRAGDDQQQRIQRAGDIYAQGQNPFGTLLGSAMSAAQTGQGMAEEQRTTNANLAASQVATARQQHALSEETKNAALEDAPVGSAAAAPAPAPAPMASTDGAADPATEWQRASEEQSAAPQPLALTGPSRRQVEADQAIKRGGLANDATSASIAATQGAESRANAAAPANIAATKAGTAATVLSTTQSRDAQDVGNFQQTVLGIYFNGAMSPQQKQQALNAAAQRATFAGQRNPGRAAGILQTAMVAARGSANATAASQRLAVVSDPLYGATQQATQHAQQGIAALQQMDQLAATYKKSLNFGLPAGLGGELNEPAAKGARDQFAQYADHIQQGLGDEIRSSTSPGTVAQAMAHVRQVAAQKVAEGWKTESAPFMGDGRFSSLPEVSAVARGVGQATQGPVSRGTYNLVNGQNGTGQNSNRTMVYGNQPAGQSGTAVAAPVRPPPGQPLQIDWSQFQGGQ